MIRVLLRLKVLSQISHQYFLTFEVHVRDGFFIERRALRLVVDFNERLFNLFVVARFKTVDGLIFANVLSFILV